MKLTKNDITICDFDYSHVDAKVDIINDAKNNTYLHYDLPLTKENTEKWYNNKDNSNRLDLTILKNNEIAGFIGLLSIDNRNKKAEYYICVDHHFSGQGIGTIASNLLLDYAFNELRLNKIYLFTEQDNNAAQHLFDKLHFAQEGLLKQDLIFNGKKINRYAYGLCKEDYE